MASVIFGPCLHEDWDDVQSPLKVEVRKACRSRGSTGKDEEQADRLTWVARRLHRVGRLLGRALARVPAEAMRRVEG